MLSKIVNHIKRYNPYSVYAAKSELKGEVSSSYLTWIWWILDPVLFMLVYVFITVVVFRSSGEYLPVVVIIGLTVWNFFNKNVSISVRIVNTFKGIVSKIYIPKYMLILEKMYVNFFKMLISFRHRDRLHAGISHSLSYPVDLLHTDHRAVICLDAF